MDTTTTEPISLERWPTAPDGLPTLPDDPRWHERYVGRVSLTGPAPTRANASPLSPDFGRSLDTLQKAREWLVNPHNWHSSTLFKLKWDGLLCTVNAADGERLWRDPWDMDLPWCVVLGQRNIRSGRIEKGDAVNEQEATAQEEP